MKVNKFYIGVCTAAVAVSASAQEPANTKDVVTIPREQYLKMLKVIEDHDKLMEEVKEVKAFKARFEESQKNVKTQQGETDQALEDLDKRLKDVKQMAKVSFPGSNKLLLTGYGSAGFVGQDNGGTKAFNASFNPIFLWKLTDRVLFEGEFEAQLEGHDTTLALEMAQISYVANDYLTLGAGKFLNPMNYFVERQHMGWVNKLPDKPLAVYDGLAAETQVGFQVRGGAPIGSTKVGYAFYVANAPELRVDPATIGPSDFGTTEFNNFDNVGRHLAVGGRVGFLPIPDLEVGYGFQVSSVKPPGTPQSVDSLLHSVDLSYVRESTRLKGTVNLKAQWMWSHIDRFTYDPAAAAGGPYLFNNHRNGGYAQIAYRPTQLSNAFLKKIEPVFRYDLLKQAHTATGVDEHRYTVGINYWLSNTTLAKFAYEFDHQSGPNAERHNAVLLQLVTGF